MDDKSFLIYVIKSDTPRKKHSLPKGTEDFPKALKYKSGWIRRKESLKPMYLSRAATPVLPGQHELCLFIFHES